MLELWVKLQCLLTSGFSLYKEPPTLFGFYRRGLRKELDHISAIRDPRKAYRNLCTNIGNLN